MPENEQADKAGNERRHTETTPVIVLDAIPIGDFLCLYLSNCRLSWKTVMNLTTKFMERTGVD